MFEKMVVVLVICLLNFEIQYQRTVTIVLVVPHHGELGYLARKKRVTASAGK